MAISPRHARVFLNPAFNKHFYSLHLQIYLLLKIDFLRISKNVDQFLNFIFDILTY